MNNKIIVSITVAITIGIIIYSVSQISTIEKDTSLEFNEDDKISSMLEKVKQDKTDNDNLKNPYTPKEREWINSGPFHIDRSEYWLGEKTFINIDEIDENIKGEMVFAKIINSTHSKIYSKIAFDGSKEQNNFYLAYYPSEFKGFCGTNELAGDWRIMFVGTSFPDLKFKIINQILPGMEDKFLPVC
tara:strand:- start:236 stop:796 length:561 start_codon:yes stop_codon:yes gene_type:complete